MTTAAAASGAASPSLAILMACHNRVHHTVRCIEALKAQEEAGVSVAAYVVDDGSGDGTADAVARILPQARILRGDGNLYWSGAMRVAFEHAMRDGHDFYLWLNDDTLLDRDALARLLATQRRLGAEAGGPVIVVGSTRDPVTGAFTYGGWRTRARGLAPTTWQKVPPDMQQPIACETANGNCVLIPAAAAERAGNIDPVFRQALGDLDYGLRAARAGCRLMVGPGYFGTCSQNHGQGSWTDRDRPVLVRWRNLLGPKGLPVHAWWVFARRHKGPLWLLSWMAPYVRVWVAPWLPRARGK
jgi:GT2 family glycosyltransferase